MADRTYNPFGPINGNSFVSAVTGDPNSVRQAGVGDTVFGIVGAAGAAGRGSPVAPSFPGERFVMLKLGGTVVRGGWLKPDASGYGVAADPASDANAACIARRAGGSGDVIPVEFLVLADLH